jgi:hypothetical protein
LNVFIDAGPVFGCGALLRCIETSGDYDSLLFKAVRSHFAGRSVVPRETWFDLWRSGLSCVNATGIGCPEMAFHPGFGERIGCQNRFARPIRPHPYGILPRF